jgi:hypothetical protein
LSGIVSPGFHHSINFSRWIAEYRRIFAFLLLASAIYLADFDPEYAGLSFVLVCAGETLRLWSAGHLNKGEISLGGPYGFVRNPAYYGSVLIAIGLCAVAGSAWIWLLALVYFTVISLPAIKYEEEILRKKFPVTFEAYSAEVPAFHPTLLKYQTLSPRFSRKQVFRNKEHLVILFLILFYAYVIFIDSNMHLIPMKLEELSLESIFF